MKSTPVVEEFVEMIAKADPVGVTKFKPSKESKARVWDLVARSKKRPLTADESAEMESYLNLEHLLRMAKARASKHLPVRKKK